MDNRTREILKRVSKVGVETTYEDHLQMLLRNRKHMKPLAADFQSERDLRANKEVNIVGSFAVPPPIQMLRIEQVTLRHILFLYPKNDAIRNEVGRKLGRVKTLLSEWLDKELAKNRRLLKLRETGTKFKFTFGWNWMVYVCTEKLP